MRSLPIHLLTVAGSMLLLATPQTMTAQDKADKPQTLEERTGYFFGTMLGRQLKEQGMQFDIDQVAAALKDIRDDKEPAMTEQEFQETMQEAQEIAQAKMKETMGAEGTKFLEENKAKEGVKVTESGLQYKVLEEGDGPMPKATDEVTVHYKGTLINGKEFDSSYGRGEPTSFPLNRVIPGWTEGLQLMKKGAKYEFYIPYDIAYGERGAGADIPPFATLIFVVELLKINGE